MRNVFLVFILLFTFFDGYELAAQNFVPGTDWKDTEGNLIEAHGGGIMKFKDTYYWYGEDKRKGNFNKTGVSGYKSKGLVNWSNIGVVLKAEVMPDLFKVPTQGDAVLERPKVIYNRKTKKFVMWMHLDANTYTVAQAGVAIADKPEGPFKFVNSFRPISFKYDYKNTRGDQYNSKEEKLGNTYRDMNLYVDDDEKGYVFYSSEDNLTMYVSRLNSSYTDIEKPIVKDKTWSRILINGSREAPAPFKFNKKYYLITSGLTGWSPNAAQYAVADSILGPYTVKGNPAIGKGANVTFGSQSTFVLKAPNSSPNTFIFLADRWNGTELEKSRYVWLPFTVKNERIQLLNLPSWNMKVFDTTALASFKAASFNISYDKNQHSLHWNKVNGAHLYFIVRNGEFIGDTDSTYFKLPNTISGRSYEYRVIAMNIFQLQLSSQNSLVISSPSV
ncbi:MAG TPA: glycoside hydrolase family 43 protein, partial [Cytophagaceae bacterium]